MYSEILSIFVCMVNFSLTTGSRIPNLDTGSNLCGVVLCVFSLLEEVVDFWF